jgi:tetratricopeptide (TPR) repeat protein
MKSGPKASKTDKLNSVTCRRMIKREFIYAGFIILLFSASTTSVLAQEKKTTRYKDYRSRSITNPEGTVQQLLAEANALKVNDAKEALNKVEEALGLSIAAGDIRGEAKCYLLLGEINETIQEWKLAMENYRTSYEKLKPKYAKETEFKTALFGLADNHLKLKNYPQAIQYYDELQNLRLTREERNRVKIGISEVHFQQGQYAEAIDVLEESNPKMKSDNIDDAGIQNQKAKIYAQTNDIDNARQALVSSQNTTRSAPVAAQPKQAENLDIAKEQVAGALHDQKRYDEEIDLRNQAIEYNLETKNLPEVTRDKVGLSNALAAKGETSEAIRELQEAALMADTIHNPKDQAKAFLALADIYEKNGRPTQALDAFKKYSYAVKKADEVNETRLTEKADLIKKQKDIEELTKDLSIGQQEETIERATVARQRIVIYGLLIIIAIVGVTSYFIYRNAQASKTANQLLALKSLRSQMNPHFIFNALNSMNQFIAQNDERTANKFLADFSRLMRLVLENSQEDFIPLTTEQEIISLYLKLEHYRFRDKFEYDIVMDENIDPETITIPPMLIQPYIENAVWHGLRYKEDKGHLTLRMEKHATGIQIEITDDGIGRKRSAALKTENQKKHQSTGLKNIEERLHIINKVYKANYHVHITDATDGNGTRVIIHVPEHKNGKA